MAKMELMIADLPHIEYEKIKKDGSTPYDSRKVTQKQVDEAYKRSLEMREQLKHKGLGVNLGKTISMGQLLASAKRKVG